jgi:hypothetical protein
MRTFEDTKNEILVLKQNLTSVATRVNITQTCLEVLPMPDLYEILKSHIASHPPDFGDGDSVLTMLYEAFAEANPMDDGRLKQDFNDLYALMNGMPLREMDKIIYPVCTLCRDHQRSGFVEGVKVGVKLKQELEEQQ